MPLDDFTEVKATTFDSAAKALATAVSAEGVDVVVNDDAKTADNTGSSVLAPLALTRAAIRKILVGGRCTSVALRARYTTAGTMSTDPVIQPFGLDKNGVPIRLKDVTGAHEITLADAATDPTDGAGWDYTDEVVVDLKGSHWLIVVIKTAAAGPTDVDIVARGL